MLAQLQVDPNELIDPTGIGWQEALLAAIVIVAAIILGALTRRLVRTAVLRLPNITPAMSVFLGRLAGWLVVLLGIVAALLILGFQLGPLFLIIALIAVVLFMSARNLLENFGAGIVLQTEKPFHVGDLVEVVDERGTVHDITGRTTVIDVYDGRRVRVPNTEILRNVIVNYTERDGLRSDITVGVEYGTDLDQARAVILRTMESVEEIRSEPPPEALVVEFGDSSIDFEARFWHEASLYTRYLVSDRLYRALDRNLRAEGIGIAFPQVVVWRGRSEGSDESQV